ncbi:GNAT family N-acetyltransferase [Roseovarius rhodophyticola]|uniref:GNAT family N-acetyltransferase n=1 Tax=Roseovarius rhodophyticola TaxID=3080827 RepID=A0ABZ2TD16_9RHOB|nr:GNAT family N-acetyltransferase [Roseovarius sp. W115]MDV2931281.1 GNAT family N-acetyltransferase [Roseovarius sp. W115]
MEDLAFILEGCRATFERHKETFPLMLSDEAFEAFYAPMVTSAVKNRGAKIHASAGCAQVATLNGQFAGYAMLVPSSYGSGFEVFDIHVLESFRKQGFGKSLLNWCKARSRQAGAHSLDATVWNLDDTREKFFEKSGFAKVNSRWRAGKLEMPSLFNRPRVVGKWGFLWDPPLLWGAIILLIILLVAT